VRIKSIFNTFQSSAPESMLRYALQQ